MVKELKYLIFTIFICLFLFLTMKYYFSEKNIKNSYRAINTIDDKIELFVKNLPILNEDTKDMIEYVEQTNENKKKKYNFWKLLENND